MKRLLIYVLLSGLCVLMHSSPAFAAESKDIKAFVMQEYSLGVPCQEARGFGSEAVEELTPMLKDQSYEAYWANIVVTLGCVGDAAAISPLEQFLERNRGDVSFATFTALQNVPTALGFLTDTGDEKALDILKKLAVDDYWQQAQLKVNDQIFLKAAAVNKSLMRSTIVALGYSDRPEAQGILEQMRADPVLGMDYSDDLKSATEE